MYTSMQMRSISIVLSSHFEVLFPLKKRSCEGKLKKDDSKSNAYHSYHLKNVKTVSLLKEKVDPEENLGSYNKVQR